MSKVWSTTIGYPDSLLLRFYRYHLREGVRMPLEIAIMLDPLPEVMPIADNYPKIYAAVP
jgi:hypothetical protein